MATQGRYPLSTAEGNSIPLEVAKPLAFLSLTFTAGSFTANTDMTLYQDKILVALADSDCYISVAQTPTSPTNGVIAPDIIHIPAGEHISFISNSIYLSVKGMIASGTLKLQILDPWSGLALEAQLSRV